MSAFGVVLTVIITISALFMIFTVLMQSSNVKGLGAIAGTFDSYFDKHKAKSAEAKLALGTKIAAAIFVAVWLTQYFSWKQKIKKILLNTIKCSPICMYGR